MNLLISKQTELSLDFKNIFRIVFQGFKKQFFRVAHNFFCCCFKKKEHLNTTLIILNTWMKKKLLLSMISLSVCQEMSVKVILSSFKWGRKVLFPIGVVEFFFVFYTTQNSCWMEKNSNLHSKFKNWWLIFFITCLIILENIFIKKLDRFFRCDYNTHSYTVTRTKFLETFDFSLVDD